MFARDVMSSPAITVGLSSPVTEVAATLRDHRIGRRYVKSHGRTARHVMTTPVRCVEQDASLSEVASLLDTHRIRRRLVEELSAQEWWNGNWQNVDVAGGVVIFKGVVESEAHRLASRVAAETLPGVREIQDDRVLAVDFSGMV